MAYLEILNGPEAGHKVPIVHDSFFVGRDPNNHLILSDRTVSRKHAVVNQLEGKFIISDLKSLKGLLINGSKVTEAALEDGDEIALGAMRVRFHQSEIEKKRREVTGWIAGILLLLLAGGVFYYFIAPSSHPSPPWGEGKGEGEIERHYQMGVQLFNRERDTQGAKREWQKVLELDPRKTTVFGQKAAKLLESVGKE